MPIYQYDQPAPNRFAGSIGDILQQQGAIQARRAEQIGQAQARAAEQGGQAWGNAVQNIGQAVAAMPGQIQQGRRAAAQDEMQALQINGVRQAARDEQLLREALSMAPNGDLRPAVEFLRKQGSVGIVALQKLTGMVQQQREQHNEAAGEIGYRIIKGGGTPDAVGRVLGDAVKSGDMTAEEAQQFQTMTSQQPDKVPTLARELMSRSKSHRALLDKIDWGKPGEVGLDALTHQPIPGATIPDPRAEEAARHAAATEERAAAAQKETERHNKEVERVAALTSGRAAATQVETIRHNRAMESLTGGLEKVVGPDGQPVLVRERDAVGRQPAAAPRASTGQEKSALAYYNRAKEAVETLTTPDKDGKSLEQRVAGAGIVGQTQLAYMPNIGQTDEQQAYRQAQRAFTEARLRKESGAAIPPAEYENDSKTYFAQTGDSKSTIEQKRKARGTVLEGLKFGAGKAYGEFYGDDGKAHAPAAKSGTVRARDPQGNLHEAPAGTPLPAGWKLEG